MNALKRCRSARAARLTCRIPRAAFSIMPPGCTSRLSSTRVAFGPSSWNVTTPAWVIPSLTFHLIRSSGRWVSIFALNSRFLVQVLDRLPAALHRQGSKGGRADASRDARGAARHAGPRLPLGSRLPLGRAVGGTGVAGAAAASVLDRVQQQLFYGVLNVGHISPA